MILLPPKSGKTLFFTTKIVSVLTFLEEIYIKTPNYKPVEIKKSNFFLEFDKKNWKKVL